ncbi:ribosomal protein S5 domain 2-like protein [Ramicandelaber brevisporus]|nr:ribosomal protein S5 domain 2-like protein [Ramicandelaber brevisporus]
MAISLALQSARLRSNAAIVRSASASVSALAGQRRLIVSSTVCLNAATRSSAAGGSSARGSYQRYQQQPQLSAFEQRMRDYIPPPESPAYFTVQPRVSELMVGIDKLIIENQARIPGRPLKSLVQTDFSSQPEFEPIKQPVGLEMAAELENIEFRKRSELIESKEDLSQLASLPLLYPLAIRKADVFITQKRVEERFGVNIKESQYNQLIEKLQILAGMIRLDYLPSHRTQLLAINSRAESGDDVVRRYLREFIKPELLPKFDNVSSGSAVESDSSASEVTETGKKAAKIIDRTHVGWVDTNGVARAIGYRKTSVANIRLAPVKNMNAESFLDGPTGEFLVNGSPVGLYFQDSTSSDVVDALYPLQVTGTLGKYNVFAKVQGGGWTGQSGALALGVARALVAADPSLKDVLEGHGCLHRDSRKVERKKTGQPKARKRYTWVKR